MRGGTTTRGVGRLASARVPRGAALRAAALSCTFAVSCAGPIRTTISPAALLDQVRQAELERDAFSPAIARALGAQQRELRLAALSALARSAEVGTSSLAAPLVGDRDEEVATWAAFALGQLPEPAAEAALVSALGGTSPVPVEVLRALGRVGTATAARDVAAMAGDARPAVRAAALTALGLISKRVGRSFPAALYAPVAVPHLRDPEREVRFGAVYALMRMPGPITSVALIPALGDRDPEIRANAARGLGLSGAAPAAFDAILGDADWRVRVEAVRALGATAKVDPVHAPASAQRLSALVHRELVRLRAGDAFSSGTAAHVLLAIVDAALELGPDGARVVSTLEKAPWSAEGLPPSTVMDLARVACAVAYALDRQASEVRRVRACGDASLPAWRREQLAARLHGLSGTTADVATLAQLAAHQDPRVRTAAVEALAEVVGEPAALVLGKLLSSNDPFVMSGAADALARPERAQLRPSGFAERLRGVLTELLREEDPGFAVAVLDAAGSLGEGGRPLLDTLGSLAQDPRPAIRRRAAKAREVITKTSVTFGAAPGSRLPSERGEPLTGRPVLTLRTPRGEVVLELFGDVAPRTTGTLVALARAGFYDDKTFHRVVSDFVVQGGCPRGDGYGGPGFAIDEEVSPLPFVRGAVGIATNGRDTGGSQFFIMHAYHPHLDGGYAVVGRVLEGQDVADALEVDDRILEVLVR